MAPTPADAFAGILPKLCGADVELGNFITGLSERDGTGFRASRALLREMGGVLSCAWNTGVVATSAGAHWYDSLPAVVPACDGEEDVESAGSSQDWGRRYLFNGGCAYVDLNHLELCLPEVLSAYDHLAYTHALYRMAWQAAEAANRRRPAGQKIHVLANNSDGQGNSYGSHLNFLIHRQAWENILYRRLLHQGYLAAYQVSSIVFTGQGKVGAENGAPAVGYQLSQRADFFEMLCGPQTTYLRPIVNSRAEPLCGSWRRGRRDEDTADLARLHVIFYDHNLCHVAGVLKVGVMQIILAMLEAGAAHADLLLEDPIATAVQWSHDPLLRARAPLFSGGETTAVELQLRFFAAAQRFVATGACAAAIPRAEEILRLWGDTLDRLRAGDLAALAPRLDWVRKLSMLQQVLRTHPDLDWQSPGLKHLDQLYASLDPADGLFHAYERNGLVDRLVTEEQIARCVHEPPADTRAWTRAALLLKAQPDEVEEVDWDFVRFRLAGGRNGQARLFTVNLSNPLDWTRDRVAPLLAGANSMADTMTALAAEESAPPVATTGWYQDAGQVWSHKNSAALSRPLQPIDREKTKPNEYDD